MPPTLVDSDRSWAEAAHELSVSERGLRETVTRLSGLSPSEVRSLGPGMLWRRFGDELAGTALTEAGDWDGVV